MKVNIIEVDQHDMLVISAPSNSPKQLKDNVEVKVRKLLSGEQSVVTVTDDFALTVLKRK
jgi:hypothetical protein